LPPMGYGGRGTKVLNLQWIEGLSRFGTVPKLDGRQRSPAALAETCPGDLRVASTAAWSQQPLGLDPRRTRPAARADKTAAPLDAPAALADASAVPVERVAACAEQVAALVAGTAEVLARAAATADDAAETLPRHAARDLGRRAGRDPAAAKRAPSVGTNVGDGAGVRRSRPRNINALVAGNGVP